MAAANGQYLGNALTLYRVASVLSAHTESAIEAAAISGNVVSDVTDVGAIEQTRTLAEYSVYGTLDPAQKLVGQQVLSDFTFDVAFDNSDATHTALRDDDGQTERSFIVAITTGTNDTTYYALDGYITSASLSNPYESQATLSVTVSLTQRSVVDNS